MLSLRRILPVGIVFGSLVLPGCESDRPEAGAAPAAAVPAIKEVPGIHNYRRWSDHVAQGGQPEGDKAFQALKAEGITTVISVDGAMPDVDAAQRLGLTYVHVPIGYDGISKDEEARIVKAVQQSKGPVFVHCHHGLHRGPAAAALARITLDGISNESAVAGLKASGCSPAYDGLFRDVLFFSVPSEQVLAAIVDGLKGGAVQDVIHLRTQYLGPEELLIAAKIALRPGLPMEDVAREIDEAEARVRGAVPAARMIYLEPDLERTVTPS